MGKRMRKSSDAWRSSNTRSDERNRGFAGRNDRPRADPADVAARVLRQLSTLPEGGTAYQISQAMGLDGRDVGQAVRQLVQQGQVLETRPGRYLASGTGGEFAATLEASKAPDGSKQLVAKLPDGTAPRVNPRYTLGAGAGDVVQVLLGEDHLALVTRILRRSGREVVGTIQWKGPHAWLMCDNRREGQLRVVSAFEGWEESYQAGNRYVGTLEVNTDGESVVTLTRLVPAQSPELTDFSHVCLLHDLPGEFPSEVEAEAKAFPKTFTASKTKSKREDLRKKLIFTIDPATAKDFDDAISLEHDEQGRWVLGVHIADVCHFVRPDTALDAEAVNRGTSIYLINRVIPMLPEVLSNGLCSLVPNQPRYCLSAFLTIDRRGMLVGTRMAETLIESRHRFTYEEAMEVLKNRDAKGKWPDDVRSVVQETGGLAQVLRRNREKAGALNLFSVEHRFRLDVNGLPVEVVGETSDESHQLIEECMLLANRAVAAWLEQQGMPCVYRLHEAPDEERLTQFASILEVYGKDSSRIQNRFGLAKLLQDLAKEPPAARRVLNYLLLRCFKKATYGVDNIGHHALAFTHYAHFTSPIRRYPDLLVHRLVKRALYLKDYAEVEIRKNYLDALAKQSTFLEQRAEQAERDLHARKAARYLAARIGEDFPAVVVSAFPGGLSVQLLETGMDGVLPLRELKDDYYEFDQKTLCLLGRHSGRRLGPGAEVDVQVGHVDIERSDITFILDPRKKASQSIREAKRAVRVAALPDMDPVEETPAEGAALAAALDQETPARGPASLPDTTVTRRGKRGTAAFAKPVAKPATAKPTPTTGRTAKAAPASPPAAPPKPAPPDRTGRSTKAAKPDPTTRRHRITDADDERPATEDGEDAGVRSRDISDHEVDALVKEADKHHGKQRRLPIDRTVDRRRLPDRWRKGRPSESDDRQPAPASDAPAREARDEPDEWVARGEPRPRKGKRKDKHKQKNIRQPGALGETSTRRHRSERRRRW